MPKTRQIELKINILGAKLKELDWCDPKYAQLVREINQLKRKLRTS